MLIRDGEKYGFDDLMLVPKPSSLSSRSEVKLETTYSFKHSPKTWTGVPIFVANMDTTGVFEIAIAVNEFKIITAIHKHYSVEEWKTFAGNHPECLPYVSVSMGTSIADFDKVSEILESIPEIDMIMLDVANGYTDMFVETVRNVREKWPDKIIIAGNVVTPEMTYNLISAGADIIKIGIGPGSVCTTRKKTGVGYPQLSAIIECADAAHGQDAHIIADGGCRYPGDFSKAICAGADFVMSGGMFAGHDESGGEIVEIDGVKYKEFYGMSSAKAMKKHAGGVASYRSSEGKVVRLPYRGSVINSVQDILGGMRSTCTYIGASEIDHMNRCAEFVKSRRTTNESLSMYNA
jgi:GMP reductase